MYLACKFFILRSIWISLVLSFVEHVFSDTSMFANDIYDTDAGSNAFSDDANGYSMIGQSSDSVAPGNSLPDNLFTDNLLGDNLLGDNLGDNLGDSLLADNLLVDDTPSCVSPSTKLGARGQACTSDANPNDSIYTAGDERLLTKDEVTEYWCWDLNILVTVPVCSLRLEETKFVEWLDSTLSKSSFLPCPRRANRWIIDLYLVTPLNYIICPYEQAYCCKTWEVSDIPGISPSFVS